MAEQLSFDWPVQVQMGPETFFVSDANAEAYAMVCAPDTWPDAKLAITGPHGAGKTHLARLFADRAGATILGASEIDPAAALPETPLVIEDGQTLPEKAEEWLFHAHNHLRGKAMPLLLTGTEPPGRWGVHLPDLASRLAATNCVAIREPDDQLLDAVLMKLFLDRQLAPKPEAVTFLRKNIDRSFEAARSAVDRLDRAALAEHRDLTRDFVREVLDIPPGRAR